MEFPANNLLLHVQELKTYFYTFEGIAKAVDGISFNLNKGETIRLVGESGCCKTTTGMAIITLYAIGIEPYQKDRKEPITALPIHSAEKGGENSFERLRIALNIRI